MSGIKIAVHSAGPGGHGFDRPLHTATRDGVVVGEWMKDSPTFSWAGTVRGPAVWTYKQWRAALTGSPS